MNMIEFKYHKISKQIVEYIHNQNLMPGTRLPSIRNFADLFSTSKNTVIRALELLEDDKLVSTQENRGAFVDEDSWISVNGISVWQRYDKEPTDNTKEKEFNLHVDKSATHERMFGSAKLSTEFNGHKFIAKAVNDLYHSTLNTTLVSKITNFNSTYDAISFHLNNKGLNANSNKITFTSGLNNSINCILRTFLQSGMYLLIEEPSSALYYIQQTIDEIGATLVPIGLDKEGILLDPIKNQRYNGRAILLISSVHQYPTGISMSERRKRALLSLCKQMNILIIEKDNFSDCMPYNSIKTIDTDGIVIYTGSFKHTLSIGLNVGWILSPEHITSKLTQTKHKQSIYNDNFSLNILENLITKGYYYDYLKQLTPILEKRKQLVDSLLETHLGDIIHWDKGNSYFLYWLDFKERNTKQIFEQINAVVCYGSMFSSKHKSYISFCPASPTEDEIEPFIKEIKTLSLN